MAQSVFSVAPTIGADATGPTEATHLAQVQALIAAAAPNWVAAPATATSPGTIHQIARDNDFIYVCTATNTWRRIALATW